MKKGILLILFLGLVVLTEAQTLKKKYVGTYEGTISSYALDFQGNTVQVPSVPIRVVLEQDGSITLSINGKSVTGEYQVEQEDKTTITITCEPDDQQIPEKLLLYKKEKCLERKGVYPQPDTFLKKV